MSFGYKIQLGGGVLFLWIVVQFFVGFAWDMVLFGLGGRQRVLAEAGHSFGGFLAGAGLLQGIVGGLYQCGMIFLRGVREPWSRSQWKRDGFVASVPLTILLSTWSAIELTILGWLYFPVSGVASSYLASYVVNYDIEKVKSSK